MAKLISEKLASSPYPVLYRGCKRILTQQEDPQFLNRSSRVLAPISSWRSILRSTFLCNLIVSGPNFSSLEIA